MHPKNMAQKKEPEPQPCKPCDGNGGWWDTGNGQKFKNRRWVTCPTCNGTGKSK